MQDTFHTDRINTSLIREFRLRDSVTGEIIFETINTGTQNGKGWLITYRSFFALIASGKLSYAAVRTFSFFAAFQDWQGFYQSSKTDLARAVGITRKTLDGALAELQAVDFIRVYRDRGTFWFYLNPDFVTQGRNRNERLNTYYNIKPAEGLTAALYLGDISKPKKPDKPDKPR